MKPLTGTDDDSPQRPSSPVDVWTGREVRALREARRMSTRQFADHLGVSDRMVSKWEAGGTSARPRPINQAALDTSLALAGHDVAARYARLVRRHLVDAGPRRSRTGVSLALDAVVHLLRHPVDAKLMTIVEADSIEVGGRRTWLPEFFIDVEPVTTVEFGRFLAATGYPPSTPWAGACVIDLEEADIAPADPAVGLEFRDAVAYARWVDKALPTRVELEQAVRRGAVAVCGREWCESRGRAIQRGPATNVAGGFRCVSPASTLLHLLAT